MDLSLSIAFIGGLISLLTPCSAMVLPTFSAAAAGRRRNLLAMSLVFSLGLLAVLIPIGLGAVTLGQLLATYHRSITTIIGITLGVLAIATILGRHPKVALLQRFIPQNRYSGVSAIFALGIVAGVSTTSCMGPVFGAIVSFASLNSPVSGIVHIFAYGLGILIPLILFSIFFDRFGYRLFRAIRQKSLKLFGHEYQMTEILSGIILLIFAYVFIFQNGMFTTSINPVSDKLLDLQDSILQNR